MITRPTRFTAACFLCLVIARACFGSWADAGLPKAYPPTFTPPPSTEGWRIRIINDVEGPIEVSDDEGVTWQLIGRVINPATRVLQGYLAAGYAEVGTVAATAVHGIRIRLGSPANSYPAMINIVPKEFAVTPMYFGGHISGASGIYTDIPAGKGLFRELAPYVGSFTYLQSGDGVLHPLSESYIPEVGDALVIIVRIPLNPLKQMIFPNTTGSAVTATYADGTTQVVTHVGRPVQGVGRFDGTSYTGVGAINTNHTCVLTISTAPVTTSTELEGVGDERRGGFQIEPAYHNTQTEEASAPQVLIIGPFKTHTPSLEGTPPVFWGSFSLAWSLADPATSWICDIMTASKPGVWQPMPAIIGNQWDAFTKLGVTAFRIHRDRSESPEIIAKWIHDDQNNYSYVQKQMAQEGQIDIARGTIPVSIDLLSDPSYVSLYIDGAFAGMTNSSPYSFEWDSSTVGDGEHLIEARAVDGSGDTLSSLRELVWVDNGHRL